MALPESARTRIAAAAGAAVTAAERLQGGDIAAVWHVTLADGRMMVAKLGGSLAVEAWMLGYLKQHSRVPVPVVIHADDDLLLMDFIAHDGTFSPLAETDLAEIVAKLHTLEGRRFGFDRDTVIGGLTQPNTPGDVWRDFFRDRRLLYMARQALDAGRLPVAAMTRIEKLCGRLHIWIGNEARPALIHGDLWGGNILSRHTKVVGLIDPALYFADPEIELAFLTLFDTAGRNFFARYGRRRPLREGFFEERRDLYNLYPLLVHTRLFGGAYADRVEAVLARYGC